MRMSGAWVSTLGRLPATVRKWSHTASLIFSVTNSRLRSGDLWAVTKTRIVCSGVNQRAQVGA
jgi:hypothetical protein